MKLKVKKSFSYFDKLNNNMKLCNIDEVININKLDEFFNARLQAGDVIEFENAVELQKEKNSAEQESENKRSKK